MTSKEAFQGIRKIELEYGGKFVPLDLHAIWTQLLQFPVAAMNHAVGEMQMIWKRMPTNHQLLDAVHKWADRLDLGVIEKEFDESEAMFSLTMGFMEGKISEAEYIRCLYAMASKYGRPEYARDAEQREAALQQKQAA